MPILNYTTKINAHKTVGEVQRTLARAGAKNVSIDYDAAGEPSAVMFLIEVAGRYINYRLPSNWEGVRRALEWDTDVPRRLKTDAQARRVSWRIVKDWIGAQMAIIEAGLATMPEVFLPYAVARDGRTLYQIVEQGDMPLLLPE